MSPTNTTTAARRRIAGFSLVEVMISVALVLLLILGVNQVFKMTTDTVGAGQAMSANVRDSRAAQTVIYNDLAAAVTANPPMFMIASGRVSAFRNRADAAGDLDAAGKTGVAREEAIRTIDMDGNNTEGETAVLGEAISPAIYNYRSHRVDRLGFFSRDMFQRQTANDGAYSNNTTSFEAWVWYGHLKMMNDANVPYEPGDEASPNKYNQHASDFALGRVVTLLKDPSEIPPLPNQTPPDPRPLENHLRRGTPPGGTAYPTLNPRPMSPLAFGTGSSTGEAIQTSRYDLAGITMATFGADLRTLITSGETTWWQRMLYAQDLPITFSSPLTVENEPPDFRYEADRFVTKPLTSAQAARLSPILLNGCSQFIVEFAGDFITQDNNPAAGTYGDRIAGVPGQAPDGILDFVVDAADVRSTRWYGMPRDVAGSATGGPNGVIDTLDVVPVRDVRGLVSPFERQGPPQVADYAAAGAMLPTARYICMWGPDTQALNAPMPQMIRITFVLDEPQGRLAEGQTYEFVITLPR